MKRTGRRLRRLAAVGLAISLGFFGVQAITPSAHAATNQFRGVNWADPRDNFVTDPIVPVGLTRSDSYATVYAKATAVLKGFQSFGSNTVRFGINSASVTTSWWNSYTAAFDAANALGMNVIIAPWLQGGNVTDTTAFYRMWDIVINKYGSNSRFYFNIMNEPWAFNETTLPNFAAGFVNRYSTIPRGRIIVPGVWSDQNLCAVGRDSRLTGTLLSIHQYTLGGETHPTEAEWITSFKNNLCGYASRAVLTEFGVPMNTGVDYNGPRDGNNNRSYSYALTDTARELSMGVLLWTGVKEANQTAGPGPCFNASCAITSLNGSGTNLSLTITNQSGLDRLRYSWGLGPITVPTTPPPSGGSTGVLRGVGSNRCVDITGASQANGTLAVLWDCSGTANQSFTATSAGELRVYGSKCLDVLNGATANGSGIGIWDCNGGANQRFRLNGDGTVTALGANKCLDVNGGATANGSKIQIWDCNGGTNQRWTRT